MNNGRQREENSRLRPDPTRPDQGLPSLVVRLLEKIVQLMSSAAAAAIIGGRRRLAVYAEVGWHAPVATVATVTPPSGVNGRRPCGIKGSLRVSQADDKIIV